MIPGYLFDPAAAGAGPPLSPKMLGPRAGQLELILRCCRLSPMEADNQERLRELCREIKDWDAIQAFCLRNGMTALVYLALMGLEHDFPPAHVMHAMNQQVWNQTRWTLYQAVELLKILKHFEARGIRAVPFKGPVLATLIYCDLRLRGSVDLDILVRENDIPAAKQSLIDLGFSPYHHPEDGNWDEVMEESKDVGFTRADRIKVELHWRTVPRSMPFLPDVDAFWNSLVTVPYLDSHVYQFAPEVLFVLLCVHHGINHFYQSMHWICDIDRFLAAYPGLDWDRVFDLAGRGDCTRAVLLGCLLARMLLGAELPSPVATRLEADASVPRLAEMILRWRLVENRQNIGLYAMAMFYCRARSDWKSRLHLVRRLIFTPKKVDRGFVRLPGRLGFLYTLVRPFRLFAGWLMDRNLK